MEHRLIHRKRKMAMHDQGDHWFGRQQQEIVATDDGMPRGRSERKKKIRRQNRKMKMEQWKKERREYINSLPDDHWLKKLELQIFGKIRG